MKALKKILLATLAAAEHDFPISKYQRHFSGIPQDAGHKNEMTSFCGWLKSKSILLDA